MLYVLVVKRIDRVPPYAVELHAFTLEVNQDFDQYFEFLEFLCMRYKLVRHPKVTTNGTKCLELTFEQGNPYYEACFFEVMLILPSPPCLQGETLGAIAGRMQQVYPLSLL